MTGMVTTGVSLVKLQGATTGNVCDAQGKTGGMEPAIKPVFSSAKVIGPAYPVRSTGADNLAWHRAIELAPAGSVLVVATGACVHAGFFGAVMATACRGAKGGFRFPSVDARSSDITISIIGGSQPPLSNEYRLS